MSRESVFVSQPIINLIIFKVFVTVIWYLKDIFVFVCFQIAEMYKGQDQIQNQKKGKEKEVEEDFYWGCYRKMDCKWNT